MLHAIFSVKVVSLLTSVRPCSFFPPKDFANVLLKDCFLYLKFDFRQKKLTNVKDRGAQNTHAPFFIFFPLPFEIDNSKIYFRSVPVLLGGFV